MLAAQSMYSNHTSTSMNKTSEQKAWMRARRSPPRRRVPLDEAGQRRGVVDGVDDLAAVELATERVVHNNRSQDLELVDVL